MELDQILFKKIFNFFDRRNGKSAKEEITKTITLSEIKGRLALLARALTGKNIDILPAEQEGGWKNHAFYLPVSLSLLPTLEENLNLYLFRLVYLSIQWGEHLNWDDKDQLQTIGDSRIKAKEIAPHILRIMEEEYPPVIEFYRTIKPYFSEELNPEFWLYGKYMSRRDVFENGQKDTLDKTGSERNKNKPTTEIKSKPVEEVEIISVDKKAQADYVMTHNFEKVETAEEFSGLWRGFDGDDSLEEDEDALSEINLRHLVRTDEVANSIYQADFRDLSRIAESADSAEDEICLTYKEWDFVKKEIQTRFL